MTPLAVLGIVVGFDCLRYWPGSPLCNNGLVRVKNACNESWADIDNRVAPAGTT